MEPKGKVKVPEIYHFRFYIDAFFELNSCRSSFSLSPIPFNSLVDYIRIYELEDTDDFMYYIRVLDKVYLDHYSREENNGKNK